jgi:hypothetical protein
MLKPRWHPLWIVLLCLVFFAVGWAVDLLLLQTPVLTPFRSKPPLTPLYAFLIPLARWTAWLFPLAAVLFVVAAPRLTDPDKVGRSRFMLVLSACAIALPVALFLVRQPWASLGSQLSIYPGEEFYYDALRVHDLSYFYENYVELMPKLSLHGKHFPPGHATLLVLVQLILGKSTFAAAVVILLTSAAGVVVSFLAFRALVSETAARFGVLAMLACPSWLDFTCTSMDAVFFAVTALALWCSLAALSRERGNLLGFTAGVALLLATLFSFSALPLGLVVSLFAFFSWRRLGWSTVTRLAMAGLGYLVSAALLYLGTGFNLWGCFNEALRLNEEFMTSVIGKSPHELYSLIAYGNAVAFVIGSGLALLPAAIIRFYRGAPRLDAFSLAAIITLAAMAFGGVYIMETERIWLFALPWVALTACAGSPRTNALRLLLAAGLSQAYVMEVVLFTLW